MTPEALDALRLVGAFSPILIPVLVVAIWPT